MASGVQGKGQAEGSEFQRSATLQVGNSAGSRDRVLQQAERAAEQVLEVGAGIQPEAAAIRAPKTTGEFKKMIESGDPKQISVALDELMARQDAVAGREVQASSNGSRRCGMM